MASHESPRADESQPSSPSQLTPKSKVRAMLATLDNNSDCGINPISVQLSLPVNEDQKTALCQYPMGKVSTNAHSSGETENENEDEDCQIVTRPRGRVAARMHAAQAKDTNSDLDVRNTHEHEKEMVKNHDEIGSVEGRVSSNCGSNNSATSISKRSKIQRARASTPKSDTSLSPPNRPRSIAADTFDSDDDLPTNPGSNPRFLALVQKIREERLAKEAEAARQKAAKATEREKLSKHHSYLSEEDDIEFSDDDEARRLQKQSRPTRKASKKALEEMHRETQRIGRNMQLAHEARTRKKISKASLFEKFNYKSAKFVENVGAGQALPGSSSPAVQSDVELMDTPPTSPISHYGENKKATSLWTDLRTSKLDTNGTLNHENNTHTSPSRLGSRLGKGKEKAVDEPSRILSSNAITQKGATNLNERLIRIRLMKNLVKSTSANDDSDSDLEIVAAKTPARRTIDSIFDRIPAAQTKESHSLQALRMLAHLTSPGNQIVHGNAKVSVTASELQMSLQQRARQQAAREKEERLQALRDKGVVVQTAEEREREMAEIEDLIAMARREGEEIMKREKDASKKERKARGEENALESSDDEEWEENGDNFAERVSEPRSESGELSGEEDLEDKEHGAMISEAETEEAGAKPVESLIDSEVSEAETAGEFTASDSDMAEDFNDDSDEQPIVQPRRRTRQLAASDDGDEDVATQFVLPSTTDSPLAKQPQSPMAPPSVLRSATKTFIPGLTVAGPAGLGLTQIFAGTMDDSQIQSSPVPSRPQLQQLDTDKDPLAFLRDLPTPTLPAFELTIGSESQGIVRDSQTQISCVPESPLSSRILHNIYSQFSQSQVLGSDSLPNPLVTQASDFPQPTQDTGFQAITPIKGRFSQPLPSTIDTMIIQNTPASEDNDTPPVAKKRRLRRRTDTLTSLTGEEAESQRRTKVRDTDNLEVSANVFDVMRKASKREKLELLNFDKKKSGAKDMVEEQAQESEDEYAGLGGASDDGSGEEEDEYAKEIIDDEGGKDIDASKLAAFYADKERANDERQIEKLFKDISSGMLRRKRGADYDLSDSDDDGEARRRMKRREFARMRKALLEDERIGKIAENPKKLAFLRAIEDRGEDDRIDFLDYEPESQEATDSTKSQSQIEDRIRDSQPDSVISPSKRKLSGHAEPKICPPPHLRRDKLNKRPSNLVEIRESLTGLIEEPNASILAQDSGSESGAEDDSSSIHEKEEEKENRDSFAHRRTKNISVVDRINLKRASSSTSSAGNTRLAFAVPSSTPGFKVPALLRRATTNSSISSGSVTSSSTSIVSSTERTAGVLSDEGRSVVKKAGRNSGVNYFARENERKMAVKAGEKRREQKMWRGAERRRKAVSGIFGAGKFD